MSDAALDLNDPVLKVGLLLHHLAEIGDQVVREWWDALCHEIILGSQDSNVLNSNQNWVNS